MKFASVRIVTNAFESLVAFYQDLSGMPVVHLADGFAELRLEGAVLAISSAQLVQRFNAGAAIAAANRSAILEFQVEDVESVHLHMKDKGVEIVMPVTVMPWGNQSLLLRDPDGSLVNVFSRPVV